MGFFNWSAPAFNLLADRWSPDSIDEIASWLRPFVRPGGRLADVGGGTGALAHKLARSLDADVTVLDPTPEMLRYVPTGHHVSAVLGSAEFMPFDTASLDAVIVTDAFHHFGDQHAAAEEMSRVVRPGGGVVIVELDPRVWYMRPIVRIEKWLGEPGAFFTAEEMCAFFADHGIAGECTRMRGPSYRFVGQVRETAA